MRPLVLVSSLSVFVMGFTLAVTSRVFANGEEFNTKVSVTSDGLLAKDKSVPAPKTGTLSTRTDNDTGVLTMESGHGIATSDKVDLYWSGGKRLGMTATVATNAVTVDGGSGDNLPALNTPGIAAMKQVEEPLAIDGDDVVGLMVYSDAYGRLTILDDGDVVLLEKVLGGSSNDAEKAYVWFAALGGSNPLAGATVAKVIFSHSDTTKTARMQAALYIN